MSIYTVKILFSFSLFTLLMVSCNNSELKVTSEKKQSSEASQQIMPSISMDSPEILETALKTDSLNVDTRLKLAAQYYANKNFDKALYHNQIVNRIDKKNIAALFNLGNVYYDTQQDESAIKYYEKFLELDKSNINVRCDLATCYMNLNNTAKAINLLRENIKLDNKHLQSHHNLSIILKQAGKTAEAEEEMKIYNNLVAAQQGMNQ